MPLGIGNYGDDEHDSTIKELIDQEDFLRRQCQSAMQAAQRYWKIYLTQRDDWRKPDESWRANFASPMGFVVAETLANAIADIMNSSDPPIQAEGVGDEDDVPARKAERLLDYTLRVNSWRKRILQIAREASIQGTSLIKVVWKDERRKVKLYPTDAQLAEFEAAVEMAVSNGAPPPPDDPETFRVWRQAVMGMGLPMPENPHDLRANVSTFRAPAIESVPLWHCRFDPSIGEMRDQPIFIQRIVRTRKWVEDRTGSGPDKPFDPKQVEMALHDWSDDRFSTEERQIATWLGIDLDSVSDPTYQNRVVLWETFRPDHEKAPYLIVMNQSAAINKDATSMPYGHGENPTTAIRNIQLPGQFLGLSDLASPEKLFYEMDAMRNLRVDSTTLATIPVFGRLAEVGLPDVVRMIRPGAVWTLPRLDAFKRLTEGAGPPPEVWREISEIKADIEEATTAYANVRGAPSTVGRVSAREAEGRANSAMTRLKVRGIHFEEELHPAVRQMLWLWYQFGTPELLLRVGGEDGEDPMLSMSKDELLAAFDIDFRFRGATRQGSRELTTQQLMDFDKTFGGILKPHRRLALASKIFENTGLKGRNEIIPKKDIAEAQQEFEAAKAAPPPAAPAPPASTLTYKDAPPDVQRQIEAMAGLQPSQLTTVQVRGMLPPPSLPPEQPEPERAPEEEGVPA